jgi:hypothetical protein
MTVVDVKWLKQTWLPEAPRTAPRPPTVWRCRWKPCGTEITLLTEVPTAARRRRAPCCPFCRSDMREVPRE